MWYYPDTKKSASRIYHGNLMEKWTAEDRYTKQIRLVSIWTYRARIMEYLKNKLVYDWKMSKNRLLTSLWHHPLQKHLLDVQRTGSAVYYRRIIWKPRKVTRNRNFLGLLWHHDIKMWLVTSFYFKLAEWHQIWVIVSGLYACQFLQPRNELLLLIGVFPALFKDEVWIFSRLKYLL